MLRFAVLGLLISLCTLGCRSVPAATATPDIVAPRPVPQSERPPPPEGSVKTESPCGEALAGLERWLSEGLLVLGELHGTVESPRAVMQAVCAASAGGRPTWLALEFPRDEQPRVESFLATGDEVSLRESPFWRRDYQDGRTSQAMMGLLREVRRLRAAGREVRILAVDAPVQEDDGGKERDEHMAERIAQVRSRAPAEPMVFLAGNLHATRRLIIPRSAVWRLVKQGVSLKTLTLEARDGTAWQCGATCGVNAMRGPDLGPEPRILETERSTKGGYDGVWYLVTFTASPPAWAPP
ncbi:MAG TPA: hypothetical protein VF815_33250 [Myxococcaceae bacterium]|jgi:hypothetical protein